MPPFLWMALIFLGSTLTGGDTDVVARRTSGLEEPIALQRLKDIGHVIEYGILAALVARAVTKASYRLTGNHAAISVVITAGYGVTDELHQYFVPNRYPGMDDIVRDTVGAIIGIAVVWCVKRLQDNRQITR